MAKGSSKEAKEEGEISDDETEEKPGRSVLNSVPHPQAHGHELQPLNLAPPTQFVGRSNRPKAKVGSAKFLRGSHAPQQHGPSFGKRLPSPKRVLPAPPSLRGILRDPSKQNNSVSNHGIKSDRQGANRPVGIEHMLNVPNKDTVNSGLPKQSPGSKLWERRRLRSNREDKEKENETNANDQDFGALLEKYKQIQEKLAEISKEEETVLQKQGSKKITIEVKNDFTTREDIGMEIGPAEADEKKVAGLEERVNQDQLTAQSAASPSLSGRSSPIIIDDDITEYTIVDEVGDRTDGTDGEKTSAANSDDDDLDELELRRNALSSLASAMSRAEEGQLTDDNSNQEPPDGFHSTETVSHSPEGGKQGQRSKVDEGNRSRSSGHVTTGRPPAREPVRRRQHSQEGRDIKARQTTRNRIPSGRSHYPRLSTSDHKIYEARRRSSTSRDYDYRRRDDARKRDEEERRPRSPERERKKDKEGPETQTREIQRILTMVEDPKEQIDQFLALINKKSENKNRRKSPVPIFKKSADIHTTVKDKTTPVAPLQDNYEEVEMDIDSDPGSPVPASTAEELFDADIYSAMQPVQPMTYTTPGAATNYTSGVPSAQPAVVAPYPPFWTGGMPQPTSHYTTADNLSALPAQPPAPGTVPVAEPSAPPPPPPPPPDEPPPKPPMPPPLPESPLPPLPDEPPPATMSQPPLPSDNQQKSTSFIKQEVPSSSTYSFQKLGTSTYESMATGGSMTKNATQNPLLQTQLQILSELQKLSAYSTTDSLSLYQTAVNSGILPASAVNSGILPASAQPTSFQHQSSINMAATNQMVPGQYPDFYHKIQTGNQFMSQHGNQSHDLYGAYTVSRSSIITPGNVSQYSYNRSSNVSNQNQPTFGANHNNQSELPNLTIRVDGAVPSSTSTSHRDITVADAGATHKEENEEEEDEAAILRAQLLKSVERKRKQKDRIEEVKVESSSSRSQSPNLARNYGSTRDHAPARSQSPKLVSSYGSTRAPVPEAKRKVQDRHYHYHLANLPIQKQVVINLGDDSSDEEEQMNHAVPSNVDKLLGGLDDFLKEARRSAESTSNLQKISASSSTQLALSQSTSSHSEVKQSNQPPVNLTTKSQSTITQSTVSQLEVKRSNQPPVNHTTLIQPTLNQSTTSQSEVKQSNPPLVRQSVISHPTVSQPAIISEPPTSQPTINEPAITQHSSDQLAINQAASEKWKKWKRERELKEMFSKCEGEVLQQSQSIAKDQALLKSLVSRAARYLQSLKVSQLKVQKLTEQLTATQKIATANKDQLEKSKKQVRSVKDRLLKRKKDYEELQQFLVAAGKEIYGEDYSPSVSTTVVSPVKGKIEPGKQTGEGTLQQRNVILKDDMKITVNNVKKSPNKTNTVSKKLSREEIAKEKERLLQLEKVYANKIKQLKQTPGNSMIVSPVAEKENMPEIVPPVKKEIPRLEKIAISTIDLTDEHEIDEKPCKRRKSLMELNPSTKPNIEVKTVRLSRSSTSSASGEEKIKVDFPEGKSLLKLHRLQRQRVDSVLQKHCQSIPQSDGSITFQSLRSQIEQIGCLQGYKRLGSVKAASALTKSSSYKYTSPLLHFKSYRFSPYFRTKANKTLTSKSYVNKLLAKKILCRFDLQGKCNDDKCRWQHEEKFTMSEKEILQDIVAYCPAVAGVTGAMPAKEVNRLIGFYVDNQIKQNQGRLRIDEMCLLLISKVTEQAKHIRPHTMFYTARPYRPKQIDRDVTLDSKALEKKDQTSFTFQKITNSKRLESDHGDLDTRYFFQNDSSDILDLESAVTENPHDTQQWLKLAAKKLHNPAASSPEDCLDQALNVLSRGIEENKQCSDLWYQYLVLYSKHRDSSDLTDFCQSAIECAPSFDIWWLYLHTVATYTDRNEMCSEILDYLCTRQDKHDLDPDISHHLLEVILYKVNLSVMVGRLQYAKNILQGYFVKSEGKISVQSYLTPCDKCVLWLSYINLNLTGELPAQLYDPAAQMSGKIVSKDNLILPLQKLSARESVLNQQMSLLQQATSVCVTSQQGTSHGCLGDRLVLYKNMILLLQLQNKLEEMLSVCRDLLQQDPTLVDIWLIVANLYAANKEVKATEQVFTDAKEVNPFSAKVFHHAASYQLSQKNSAGAIECLKQCSKGYFDTSQLDPLLVDPVLCYSCVLKQSLPLGYTPPPLKAGVTEAIVKQEQVYLWLNYCLYLELQNDMSQAIEMYETALSSLMKAVEICMVWLGYLEFQYRQLRVSTENVFETKKFAELIHRCLITMPSKFEIPHWSDQYWNNFAHVNKIIDWYLKVLVPEQRSVAFDRLVTLMPTNIPLVFRASEECLRLGEDQKALCICYPLVFDHTQNQELWKLITSLALKQGSHKEIRRMFHRAVQTLPYSANLWKDFLTFELTQGRAAKDVIIGVISHCEQLGIPLEVLLENLPEIKLVP